MCKRVIDVSNMENTRLIIFFKPFDIIDIIVNCSAWTFLSDWKDVDNIFLDVYANDLDGKILELGTFDSNSKLMANNFKTTSYTLRIICEAAEEQKFALLFSFDSKNNFQMPPGFRFPFFKRYPDGDFYDIYISIFI